MGGELFLGVRLVDDAIATSGNYRLYRESKEGAIVSHIVDPRGGEEESDFRSVSVIHVEAMSADAWATALFVLGEEEGIAVAKREGLAVCFLRREESGEVVMQMTPGFEERVSP
jgi:thiamine biosynthesis lipoprotein